MSESEPTKIIIRESLLDLWVDILSKRISVDLSDCHDVDAIKEVVISDLRKRCNAVAEDIRKTINNPNL